MCVKKSIYITASKDEDDFQALLSPGGACEKCAAWPEALQLLPSSSMDLLSLNAAMCACHKGGCRWQDVLQLA